MRTRNPSKTALACITIDDGHIQTKQQIFRMTTQIFCPKEDGGETKT